MQATDTPTAPILISRLCSNAGAAFQNAPWKETFTHCFCTCHPEMWWWGWSKWKWQQNWAPPLFPLFNSTLCTGAWPARSTAQGHTFPHAAFPSSWKIRMVQGPLPTPWSFSSGVFCDYRTATNMCSYPEWLHGFSNKKKQKKQYVQRIPRLN